MRKSILKDVIFPKFIVLPPSSNRNLVQSTAKVHNPQLILGTKIIYRTL